MTDRFPAQLNVFYDVEQGSDEWHDLRRGMVTASTIGALLTEKTVQIANNATTRNKIVEIAAERITQRSLDPIWSRDIERGHLEEPYAREAYAEHKGVEVAEVGFMVRKIDGHLIGYSPDGIVHGDGLIEAKSRNQRIQIQHILDGEVPAANMAQLQTGLFVSGREWIDYLSFSNGMPMWVERVYPIRKWQTAIGEALIEAESRIAKVIADYGKAVEGMPVTEWVDHYEGLDLIL